jgi:hypothetical protein
LSIIELAPNKKAQFNLTQNKTKIMGIAQKMSELPRGGTLKKKSQSPF